MKFVFTYKKTKAERISFGNLYKINFLIMGISPRCTYSRLLVVKLICILH